MSDLRARIGERLVPTKFGNGFYKASRQPASIESNFPSQAPLSAPGSLLNRIGPVGLVSSMARTTLPNFPFGVTVDTGLDHSTTETHPKDYSGSPETLAFHSDNLLPNNGGPSIFNAGHSAQIAHINRSSDAGKFRVSSTSSTPKSHSSETLVDTFLPLCHELLSSSSAEGRYKPSDYPQMYSLPPGSALRDNIVPLVMKNVTRRPNFDNTSEPEGIQKRLREALTDEFCGSLVEKMQSIQIQMRAIKSEESQSASSQKNNVGQSLDASAPSTSALSAARATVPSAASIASQIVGAGSIPTPPVSASLPEPPSAPRAMRVLEKNNSFQSTRSSALLNKPPRKSRSRDTVIDWQDSRPRSRWDRGGDPPVGSISAQASLGALPGQHLEPHKIAIPLDPSFFATTPISTTMVKRESPSPSHYRGFISRRPISRSPRRHSPSVTSRRSFSREPRSATKRRYPSPSGSFGQRRRSPSPRHPISREPRSITNHQLSSQSESFAKSRRSPSPRYRSRSRDRQPPVAKRRRLSFSRPPSPVRTYGSTFRTYPSPTRRRNSPIPLRRQTPVHLRAISRRRASLSPAPRREKIRTQSPPKRNSPSPPRRRTPVHLRSISRQHVSPSPIPRRDRTQSPLNQRPLSPAPCHSPPGPLLRSLSLPLRSPSPERRTPSTPRPSHSFRYRLEAPLPLADDPSELLKFRSLHIYIPQPVIYSDPVCNTTPGPDRERTGPPTPADVPTPVLTPVLNYDLTRPPTPVAEAPIPIVDAIKAIKDEPDAEDYTAALRSSRSTPGAESPLATPTLPPVKPLGYSVPGLWLVKTGLDQSDILECEFEVDAETAARWNLPGSSKLETTASSRKLSLHLLSLRKDLWQTVSELERVCGVTEAKLVSLKSETKWPPQGSLIVQMNHGKPTGRSWLPSHMGPNSAALDVTESLHEGSNVIQLIQLDDMTDTIFALCAMPSVQNRNSSTNLHWEIAVSDLPQNLGSRSMQPAIIEVM